MTPEYHSTQDLAYSRALECVESLNRVYSPDHVAILREILSTDDAVQLKLHRSGASGREVCQLRSSHVDRLLSHLFRCMQRVHGRQLPSIALLALGGYGRAELNPLSDLDVMFMVEDVRTINEAVGEATDQFIKPLYDLGFKISPSQRGINDAVDFCMKDMETRTACMDARHIAGAAQVFPKFRELFLKRCVSGYEDDYIQERVKDQTTRHKRHGKTVYMQEPNIKNGCGGLRDYQNLIWMAFYKLRVRDTRGLVAARLITEQERDALDKAYDFLLRVRNELHYTNQKASADTIVLSQELQIADALGYSEPNILRRIEAFMREYYQSARTVYFTTELVCEKLSITMAHQQPKRSGLASWFPLGQKVPVAEYFDGFHSSDGRIYADHPGIFEEDSLRLIRLFGHVQERRHVLSAELRQLVKSKLHLVDETFRYMSAARDAFLHIMGQKGEVGRVLRAMHDVDLLGAFMPEFAPLTALVQHEFFHRYTADEHTLVCIEKLDEVHHTREKRFEGYHKLFESLEDPAVLYLALLLHDTGKSANARHHDEVSAAFAQRVSRRFVLNPERRKSLILLVNNHVLLSMTAQRRNVDDPTTITEFSEIVRSQPNLDALMLLTLADGRGVGDDTWSDWKETLVWQLFRNTSEYLRQGEAFYRLRAVARERMRQEIHEVLDADYSAEIDSHFESMPDRYLQAYSPADIADHLRLFRSFFENHLYSENPLKPAMKWVAHPDKGHSEFLFCGWDRRMLLARIAASMSCAGLNILSADIYTRSDNLVFDIFRVCTLRNEAVTHPIDLQRVEKLLIESLQQEEYNFAPHMVQAMKNRPWKLSRVLDFPTKITIEADKHPHYTIVEFQSPDRPGLLYKILIALAAIDARIVFSRIDTDRGAAIDSFYITNADGEKIVDAESLHKLELSLRAVPNE